MVFARPTARRKVAPHLGIGLVAALSIGASGCMSLTPQLRPTDYERLDDLQSRDSRDEAFAQNTINVHQTPAGTRYTKGPDPRDTKRSWQSLDAVLRSDVNSAAALPDKKLRAVRVLTVLGIASGLVTTAGLAASAREGLDLSNRITGGAAMMVGGGVATVAFAIAAGVLYGQARKDYEKAVDLYNDSLGMRLGIYDPDGAWIPPGGLLIDDDGFVVVDEELAKQDTQAKPLPLMSRVPTTAGSN